MTKENVFYLEKNKIKLIIKSIRDSFEGSEWVYKNGSCYHFYKILKSIYPDAEPFYSYRHVVTKIYGEYFDITGCVKGDFLPYEKHGLNNFHSNNFSIKQCFIECDECGHPVSNSIEM